MTPKQFVDRQLGLPEYARFIPDHIYMAGNRLAIIHTLRVGIEPFHPGEVGNYKYYPNGVFSP